jgi:hypothetical protein
MSAVAIASQDLFSLRGLAIPDYGQSATYAFTDPRARPRRVKVRMSPRSKIPDWLPAVADRLVTISALPDDWDRYGGRATDPRHFGTVLRILARVMDESSELPWIVPLPSGGLQLEWDGPRGHLQFVIDDDEFSVSVSGPEEWERPLREAWPTLESVRGLIPSGDA